MCGACDQYCHACFHLHRNLARQIDAQEETEVAIILPHIQCQAGGLERVREWRVLNRITRNLSLISWKKHKVNS